jgi:hypothetical protein
MKRLLPLIAAAALSCALHAQTTIGPESTNNNRNEPAIRIQPQGPAPQSNAPQGPTAPGTTTTTPAAGTSGGQSSATPGQTANTTATGASTQAPANNAPNANAPANKANPNAQDAAPGRTDPVPQENKRPTTEILPEGKALPSADPLMEPGELPKGHVTLVGGTATKVDRLRNRVTLQPFGGGNKMTVRFDERSHIYRDGRETTVTGIKEGDRVYADTMLLGPVIFARNIRVLTTSGPAEARGQVTQYDAKTGRVTLLDDLTRQPVQFTISRDTAFRGQGNSQASAQDVLPGALLDVQFSPGHGRTGEARDIAVLARPGANYVFAGRVTNLDMHSGVMSVDNQTDSKNYDLHFDPARVEQREQLRVGAEITARATFDGKGYLASDVTVAKPAEESAQQ